MFGQQFVARSRRRAERLPGSAGVILTQIVCTAVCGQDQPFDLAGLAYRTEQGLRGTQTQVRSVFERLPRLPAECRGTLVPGNLNPLTVHRLDCSLHSFATKVRSDSVD